jgi:hypothetical protein
MRKKILDFFDYFRFMDCNAPPPKRRNNPRMTRTKCEIIQREVVLIIDPGFRVKPVPNPHPNQDVE